MRYFSIPGTDLRPAVIGLGTGSLGSGISEDDSFRILDAYAAAGGNFIDTAHLYAAWLPGGAGKSEVTIGKWLKASGQRGAMIVATKGGHFDMATPDISRVTPDCIAQDIEESLERLQIDSIDLYYLHRDDPEIPTAELLEALQPHLRAGRCKAIAASNWTVARLQSAIDEARARDLIGFCCNQCGWSLAGHNPELQGQNGLHFITREDLAFYRSAGFPLIGFGSQAQGFFAQSWSWPDLPNPTAKQQALRNSYHSENNVLRWQRATELAKRHGCSANSIALAYLTNQPFPSGALVGPNSVQQLHASLEAADLVLSADEVTYLEADPAPDHTNRQGLSAQAPA